MYKILLCCAAGMSTSLLVTKMEQYCKAQGIEAKIWAVPVSDLASNLPVDVVLLGPQIRFQKKKAQEIAGDIPVVDIEMKAYGTMNGEAVVKTAMKVING